VPNETQDRQHLIDSCKLSTEISKQFITLAAAGVAFLVGLSLSDADSPVLFSVALASLAISVLFGLLFLMMVVGNVNKGKDFDVYALHLRIMATLQIMLFLVAFGCLGWFVVTKKLLTPIAPPPTALMRVDASDVVRVLPAGASMRLEVSADGRVILEVGSAMTK